MIDLNRWWNGAAIARLDGWSPHEQRRLRRLATVCEFEPGDFVIVKGWYADALIVVTEGWVTVHPAPPGSPAERFGPGTQLGGRELVERGSRYAASAIAATYVTALSLPAESLGRLFAESPSLREWFRRAPTAAPAVRLTPV
jgi:CRP-like cAMP-binding protein